MSTIQIEKGKLAGLSLKELTDGELREFANSALATEMKECSFYKGQLENVIDHLNPRFFELRTKNR